MNISAGHMHPSQANNKPFHKYHVKLPKNLSGHSQNFFQNISKKFLNISTKHLNIFCEINRF